MKVLASALSLRWVVMLGFAGCSLLLLTSALGAAESVAPLQANVLLELVSNRSRLLQVSLVCVALGCAMLWWKR